MTTADQQPQVLADGVTADALGRAAAGPSTWSLDAAHSSAAFRHKTIWGLVTVRGTFSDLAGRAEILPDGSARGRVDIGAASLNTKNAKRDTHLKSADFFDAQAHPRIVVDVRRATRSGGSVNVSGDLTAAGITRPLDFTATVLEASADAVTLRAEVEVDRASFNMTWNQMGMLKGLATVSVVARFTRSGGTQAQTP
ncbi:MAG TPA: YceI family protein [Streptosporangiaceae bacterium]